MTLSYRGEEVAQYSPDEDQWWCTTWVPSLQNADPADITATYTVHFSSNPDMFEAFMGSKAGQNGDWVFHDNLTATLSFRRKKKGKR